MRTSQAGMNEEDLEELGSIMNDIGVEGTRIIGGDPDGLYIYAEVDNGSVFGAVFKDEGRTVRYFDPTRKLFGLIREAWASEGDEASRWVVLEYEVRGSKFDVVLGYPEEIDPDEHASDRRERALQKRYRSKPVIYPPMPEHLKRLRRD